MGSRGKLLGGGELEGRRGGFFFEVFVHQLFNQGVETQLVVVGNGVLHDLVPALDLAQAAVGHQRRPGNGVLRLHARFLDSREQNLVLPLGPLPDGYGWRRDAIPLLHALR